MNYELPITIAGKVMAGNRLGRTIDVPTANIIPNEDLSEIDFGVYYSITKVDGNEYRSISNLGRKPTVKDDNVINVETFIFDFEGDIYGDEIEVTLLEFRRPEVKFESFEELSKVIKADLQAGRNYSKTE